jgi:RNA-directed DNA polymerase
VVSRRTAASRISRFAKAIAEWCRSNRHQPMQHQHQTLSQKLQGHYGCYRLTGNYALLRRVKQIVVRAWGKWLSRRSWRGRLPGNDLWELLERLPLPAPRVVHSVYRSG